MSDFYDITHEGQRLVLPRVTSILKVIDKSGPLMGWAVKMERESFKAALEEVLTAPGERSLQQTWEQITKAMSGRRAHARATSEAADIGKAAHDIIRWHTQRMLGQDAGPEPSGPDAAMRAVVAWMDWCREVDFEPRMAERLVYCPQCAYAGTLDGYGKVQGQLTLVDLKTGKAVYREAFLQVRAYEHALAREGVRCEGALILRLPKTAADPGFEVVPVPEIPHGVFRAIATTWRAIRWLDGDEYGSERMTKCEVQ